MHKLKQHKLRVGVGALALFFASIVLVTRPESDPFERAAVSDPPFTPLTYGIQTFLWWDGGQVGLHLDWVRLMNFSHVKQVFAWRDIQPERERWDFAAADAVVDQVASKGLRLVARLTHTPEWAISGIAMEARVDVLDTPPDDLKDMAIFCAAIASRYRGRIAAYQIWNEPNLRREWGGRPPNAAEFADLLKSCSEAIRAADPEAILISPGLAPTGQYDDNAHRDDMYLQALYDAGFEQSIDVVGVHAPGFTPPEYGPDDAERDGKGRWATFRRVEDLRKIMIKNGDAARQMAILEVGWTTDQVDPDYAWYAVSEEEQARYLVQAYEYAAENWRPWIGLMSAIYIAAPTWTPDNEQYWWAITTPDNLVRPAFIDLANMAKYCGARVIPARAPDSPEAQGLVTTRPCD